MFTLISHPTSAKPFPETRLVERRVRLDVWELQRSRGLVPGSNTVISVNGECVARLHTLSADRIMVTTDGGETAIMLTWDTPMHPCLRLWFQCSACQKRCRHLYLPELRCRSCLALQYSIQHLLQHSNTPRIARLKRLRGKPQRRRARYWRLSKRISLEEARLAGDLRRFNKAVEGVRDGRPR
jgi:hypothetical protein